MTRFSKKYHKIPENTKKPMRFGRVFLSAAPHALGIEAASFASLPREAGTGSGIGNGRRVRDLGAGTGSEQRYSGKPDGIAGTLKDKVNRQRTTVNSQCQSQCQNYTLLINIGKI